MVLTRSGEETRPALVSSEPILGFFRLWGDLSNFIPVGLFNAFPKGFYVFSSTVRFLDNASTPGPPLYTIDTQSVISGLFKITEGQALLYVALILLSLWTSSEPVKVSICEMNFTLSFPYPSPDFRILLEQQHPPTPIDRRDIF